MPAVLAASIRKQVCVPDQHKKGRHKVIFGGREKIDIVWSSLQGPRACVCGGFPQLSMAHRGVGRCWQCKMRNTYGLVTKGRHKVIFGGREKIDIVWSSLQGPRACVCGGFPQLSMAHRGVGRCWQCKMRNTYGQVTKGRHKVIFGGREKIDIVWSSLQGPRACVCGGFPQLSMAFRCREGHGGRSSHFSFNMTGAVTIQ